MTSDPEVVGISGRRVGQGELLFGAQAGEGQGRDKDQHRAEQHQPVEAAKTRLIRRHQGTGEEVDRRPQHHLDRQVSPDQVRRIAVSARDNDQLAEHMCQQRDQRQAKIQGPVAALTATGQRDGQRKADRSGGDGIGHGKESIGHCVRFAPNRGPEQ
jgi:hypothetical protein